MERRDELRGERERFLCYSYVVIQLQGEIYLTQVFIKYHLWYNGITLMIELQCIV